MANDNVATAGLHEHLRGNFAGKSAFFFPEHILPANGDVRAPRALDGGGDRRVRRCDDDVAMLCARGQRHKGGEERASVRLCLEHLPVAGNHATSFRSAHYLLVSASTPGSLRPARNSREAPPPVEMCETLSATPAWCTAATESPPPTIEVAPPEVA